MRCICASRRCSAALSSARAVTAQLDASAVEARSSETRRGPRARPPCRKPESIGRPRSVKSTNQLWNEAACGGRHARRKHHWACFHTDSQDVRTARGLRRAIFFSVDGGWSRVRRGRLDTTRLRAGGADRCAGLNVRLTPPSLEHDMAECQNNTTTSVCIWCVTGCAPRDSGPQAPACGCLSAIAHESATADQRTRKHPADCANTHRMQHLTAIPFAVANPPHDCMDKELQYTRAIMHLARQRVAKR